MTLHMVDTVDFMYLGSVDVSTCDTPDNGWETCVFFNDGHSVVVANYVDIEAAVIGHHAFLQRDVLWFITRNHRGSL